MRDSVRVSLESDHEADTARIHDTAGEVSAGDATLRFEVDGIDPEEPEASETTDESNTEDGGDPTYIAPVEAVPSDSTLRCEARDGRRGTEIILRRDDGDVFAWRNSCPHKPEVRLDPGGGAIVDDEQLVCHEHGARFECGDGYCSDGPCRGDALGEIEVAVRDGAVYLVDERFDACVRLD